MPTHLAPHRLSSGALHFLSQGQRRSPRVESGPSKWPGLSEDADAAALKLDLVDVVGTKMNTLHIVDSEKGEQLNSTAMGKP